MTAPAGPVAPGVPFGMADSAVAPPGAGVPVTVPPPPPPAVTGGVALPACGAGVLEPPPETMVGPGVGAGVRAVEVVTISGEGGAGRKAYQSKPATMINAAAPPPMTAMFVFFPSSRATILLGYSRVV